MLLSNGISSNNFCTVSLPFYLSTTLPLNHSGFADKSETFKSLNAHAALILANNPSPESEMHQQNLDYKFLPTTIYLNYNSVNFV